MKKIILGIMAFLMVPAICAWAAPTYVNHKQLATMHLKITDCNMCHVKAGVPPTHNSMWVKDHRFYAESKPNNCQDCHQLSFCQGCHYGGELKPNLQVSTFGADYMPKSHMPDFLEMHPIKARSNPRTCDRCHDRRFCQDCHAKFKDKFLGGPLNIISHRVGWSQQQIFAGGPEHGTFSASQCQQCHPKGVLPQNVWAPQHAEEARTNLASCQTCHPQGQVCIKCHSATTGLEINPHPAGWTGTLDAQGHIISASGFAGRLQSAGGSRTCIQCHR